MAPSCTSIDNLKVSVKAIYSARLTRINILRQHLDKLKKMEKLSHVPCFSTSTAKPKSYKDKTQMFLGSRSVCCLLSHMILDAICRLNSSNSIGSECCLEFIIFLQPIVRVTIIDDLVTTFIVVYDKWLRFYWTTSITCN